MVQSCLKEHLLKTMYQHALTAPAKNLQVDIERSRKELKPDEAFIDQMLELFKI
ncbi:hypothetical protein U0035_04660 [Niabella yanshanensis]|uniref:Uncharacterized protein n=1 Tax=Niabella yanshanensis TaxID=577386 RepID=A0ABZ0W8F9_9BACT|nr:hypothetical protein [Niabella yanshanensis]WQD39436.1 hypothetical protein U0035_04660 [Niabella yanshanensis]